ncbi:unnamed protein product [Dibothriocephalus latus]|uniref:Abasic site processing protein HMCES n=1 Tax=Dibothriocephalus latus TaxID=60516 RepID=A0A3P7P8V0_DIBLA|nr:unnamed protein product [Dibothriocephalus latus]
MAGLFSISKNRDLFSYTVITTDAVNEVASIHNRMPVIFSNFDDAIRWVQGDLASAGEVRSFLAEMIAKLPRMDLLVYPVTPRVNSSFFDDPACIQPQEVMPRISTKLKTPPSKTLDAFMIISPRVGAVVVKKEEDESFKHSKLKTPPSKTLDAFMSISPKVGAVVVKKGERESFKQSPPQSFGELFHARKRSFSENDSNTPPKHIKSEYDSIWNYL